MSRFFRCLLTALLVFTAASAFCLLLYHYDNKYTQSAPQAIAGTLFVSEDDLAAYPVRSLWNGWNFYPDVLLSPKTCENRDKSTVRSVQIGAYSNFAFGSTERTPHGCGTYMLTLLLPETPRRYLIELPEIFSAYRFYIDDELVLSAGETNAEQYRSRLQNRAASFKGSGTVRLLLAVRDESWIYSGMTYPPAFGTALGVNTQRAVRVCISAAMLTLMLLFASFALWLCLGSMRCPPNSRLFLLLSLSAAVLLSGPVVHALKALPVQPWYTIELVSGYLTTLLIVLLHGRICALPNAVRKAAVLVCAGICGAALLCGVCAAHLSEWSIRAFSDLTVLFRLAVTVYLLGSALYAARRREWHAGALFCADIFYGTLFLWDCLLPAYEPILGKWFYEWGCLLLVCVLGAVFWQDIAQGYRRSLTFTEEQRQMARQLAMQKAHFAQISEKIEESRRQRHDFRQHLRTIAGMAGDPEAQLTYISRITALSEATRPESYCHDPAVDAMLYYYVSSARRTGIRVSVRAELSEDTAAFSVQFCTILGNLLENALEACWRLPESTEKSICLHMKQQFRRLYVVLENSYDGEVNRRGSAFLSRKHTGSGIGTASVRELTHRLGGTVEFEPRESIFRVVLILPERADEEE